MESQDIEQQRSYLRISEFEIGLLINFCAPNLEIKRFIFTNDRKPFLEKLHDNNSKNYPFNPYPSESVSNLLNQSNKCRH